MSEDAERLLAELHEATLGLGRSKRLRLAVTPPEYIQVRQCILSRDGRFYGRVRNVPLVIDDHAAKPPFFIESEDPDGEAHPQD
jgi:hypothetical protein